MLWADLAITGGGLTKYEAAVTGTPSIVISQVDYQARLMLKFEREGTAVHLGLGADVEKAEIVQAVECLLRDHSRRESMGQRGKRLVDGKGRERIIAELPLEVWSKEVRQSCSP